MNYLRAAKNWGQVAARAVLYGTPAVTLGRFDHRLGQRMMQRWCAGSAKGLNLRHRLVNRAKLDAAPQCVYVANHLSALDILVLGAHLSCDYRWLAKSVLFKVPFSGWHLKVAGHIPVYRGKEKHKNADIGARIHSVVADEGASLLFFPEGTRSRDGKLKPFRIGAFRTAVTEGLPVVPLVVEGTDTIFKPDEWDLELVDDREVTITALDPIYAPTEGDERERAHALRAAVFAAFHQTLCPDEALEAGQEDAEAQRVAR